MSFDSYSEQIRQQIADIRRALSEPGGGVFSLLRAFEEDTRGMKDHLLKGYVCYSYAHAYYIREQYDKVFPNLKRALRYLLRSGEHEITARTLNLFAVNAQRLGCYDIAYNYYRMALSFVDGDRDSLMSAVIRANTGDLMAEMGDFKTAVSYIRHNIPVVKRNKSDPMYKVNLITIYINLGISLLFSGDIAGARKTLGKVEKLITDETPQSYHLWLMLFRAQLTLQEGNLTETSALLKDIINLIVTKDIFDSFMKDVLWFCNALMRKGEWESAGLILRKVTERDFGAASDVSKLRFSQLKIEYYRATGSKRKLSDAYAERHALSCIQLQVQKDLYHQSFELIRLTEELREEQERKRIENTQLREQAVTDALTGLPNRYAFNNVLEKAYEHAWRKKLPLGVGIVDIDAFKDYNDKYGHVRGDECLVEVAEFLRGIADEYDLFLARYGGDEFVFIYENIPDDKLSHVDREIFEKAPVSVSYGYYMAVPDDKIKLWDFLAQADRQMYKAKRDKK